ncbi:hypothetical protein [Photobacterium leiognathi]|uniref:hypothetical protein n=1 Tax=Photobacterium leiognathi TaxID=553611 RepID=UPI002733FB2E|nr:hypothetical protein [Photobacterium leiognathi]
MSNVSYQIPIGYICKLNNYFMALNKTILATALLSVITVSGCGGSDSSDESINKTPDTTKPEVKPTTDTSNQIKLSLAELNGRMNSVDVLDLNEQANLCDGESKVLKTKDLTISYNPSNNVSDKDLDLAARLSQVAFEDLIKRTKLNKEEDLNIRAVDDNWTVCVKGDKTLNGTGDYEKFTFSPDRNDIMMSYLLAKHELFHVAAFELKQDNIAIPHWFNEATAEHFADRNELLVTHKEMNAFINGSDGEDAYGVPFAIDTFDENKHYDMAYEPISTALNYLIDHGLSDADMIEAIKSHDPIKTIDDLTENKPYTIEKMKSETDFNNEVVYWMKNNEKTVKITPPAHDGVTLYGLQLSPVNDVDYEDSFFIEFDEASSTALYNARKLVDGKYYTFMIGMNESEGDNYVAYGSIEIEVKNGIIPEVDFSKLPIKK